jgi:NADH:ubiquinone oxidoreductase subunit K
MANAKKTSPRQYQPLFGKENYRWMLIGIVVMALGLFLMAGGKSKDPNVFDPKQVYSFTRITVAPILILVGLALEIVAIFKKSKSVDQ